MSGYRGRGGGYRGGGGGGQYSDGQRGGGGQHGYSNYNDDSGYVYENNRGGGYQDGGRGGGGYQGDNSGYQGGNFNQGRGRGRGRGRYKSGDWGRGQPRSNTWQRDGGSGGGGDNQRRNTREEAPLPATDVMDVVDVPAHTKKLAAIIADPATRTIYTGSHDGTVKCWSTETGQMTSNVEVGGQVDSLLLSGGFLFVGLQKAEEGIIKVWNTSSGQHHQLPGHRGQILCMQVAAGMLFSGGQDRSVRVWNFNAQAGIFMSQAIITKEEGGHDSPVHSFQSSGSFLFSSDRLGLIKAWDLTTGKVAQTIEAHSDAITQMLIWESFLLTASSDGSVKAFQIQEQPQPNFVLKAEPEFSFSKDAEESGGQQHKRGGRRRGEEPDKIFTMAGTLDSAGTPILMVPYLSESFVRLYELPSFASRGTLTPAPDTRSLAMMLNPEFSKGFMMLSGDSNGGLHWFRWKDAP